VAVTDDRVNLMVLNAWTTASASRIFFGEGPAGAGDSSLVTVQSERVTLFGIAQACRGA